MFPIVLAAAEAQQGGTCGSGGLDAYQCSAHCDAYSVWCDGYTVQCDAYSISVQGDGYSVQCDAYSVWCDVYSVQCDAYSPPPPADTIPPVVTNVQPRGTVYTDIGGVSFDFYDPEPSGGMHFPHQFQLFVDETQLTVCTGVPGMFGGLDHIYCTAPPLDHGLHIISGWIQDDAGNTTPISGSFTNAAPPYLIGDDSTGGDCELIGNWEPLSKTCTLENDLTTNGDAIEIISNGVTLNGNGHTIMDTDSDPYKIDAGVQINGRSNVTVTNLSLDSFLAGIKLETSFDSHISGNDINGTNAAYVVYASDGNNLSNNSATACGSLIGAKGITLEDANNNTLTDNHVDGCGTGLFMVFSNSNILRNNSLDGNTFDFSAGGSEDSHFINDIDTSNTVSGKPMYYIVGASGQTFDASTNAGVFYCIGCDKVNIEGLDISNNGSGIYLRYTTGSRVSGNNIYQTGEGLSLENSSGNLIVGNTASQNRWIGMAVRNSDGNRMMGNTISFNNYGFYSSGLTMEASDYNMFYNNAVVSNYYTQADIVGGSGNIFDLPKPVGGNYWSDWTGPDSDGDGFVDIPRVFGSNQDDLPWTMQQGWCDTPSLRLSLGKVYWGSLADYQVGRLSIDYRVDSFFDVSAIDIVGAVNTNGVILETPMPLPLGDVAAGGSVGFTLKYHVPDGVATFKTTTYITARDICGNMDEYPGPLP